MGVILLYKGKYYVGTEIHEAVVYGVSFSLKHLAQSYALNIFLKYQEFYEFYTYEVNEILESNYGHFQYKFWFIDLTLARQRKIKLDNKLKKYGLLRKQNFQICKSYIDGDIRYNLLHLIFTLIYLDSMFEKLKVSKL